MPRDLTPRRIPPAASISKEARAFLANEVDPAPFLVRPSSSEEWIAIRHAMNPFRGNQAEHMMRTLPVTVKETQIAGVTVRRITPHDQPAGKTAQIVLELHGGAYVLYDGLAGLTRALKFSAGSGYSVLAVDYRMPPEHPYPAALEDALAVYRAVLGDYDPSGVGVFGTSAGGNLAACLCLELASRGLTQPQALVLNSPWTDMTPSGDSFSTLETIDPGLYTYHGVIEEAAKLYADGRDLSDPRLSPLNAQLPARFPETLLVTGTRDLLLSDTARFHKKLRASGQGSELLVYEGMWHAFSDVPEEDELYRDMTRFFEARLGARATG